MGESNYLGCKTCKELLYLGKLTEKTGKKSNLVWLFLRAHQGHDLLTTSDLNPDGKLIKAAGSYWWTECSRFEDRIGKPEELKEILWGDEPDVAEEEALDANRVVAFKDWRFLCALAEVLHHLDYLDLRDYFQNRLLKAPMISREELERYESEIRSHYGKLLHIPLNRAERAKVGDGGV
jgi:hypothetical protein